MSPRPGARLDLARVGIEGERGQRPGWLAEQDPEQQAELIAEWEIRHPAQRQAPQPNQPRSLAEQAQSIQAANPRTRGRKR